MRISFIINACVIVIGCSSPTQNHETGQKSNLFEVVLTDSLNIELDEFVYPSYSKHQVWKDSLFFGLKLGAEPNTLSVFNLEKEKFVKKIKIDRNFFKSDISSFYVHNPDSIYFFSFQSKNIYLIDFEGNKINEWNVSFKGENPFGDTDFMFPTFVMYDNVFFDKEKNHLICPIISQRFHELPGNNELPSIAVIDLNISSIVKAIVPPMGKMLDRGSNFYPDDISVIQTCFHDGNILVSYPIDPVIYRYSLESGELIDKSQNYINSEDLKFLPPMSYEDKKDRRKSWKYRVQTPYFENIRYHSSLKIFSRIFHHLNESLESEVDIGQFRTSTIFLYDEDLKLIGKQEFFNSQLGAFRSVATSDGYLSAPHDFYQTNENYLTHKYLYKIKPIKP